MAIKYGNETPAMHHASNQAEGHGKGEGKKATPAKSVVCLVCLSVCVCVLVFVPFELLLLFSLCFLFNLSFALLLRFVFMLVARLHISVISAFIADI